jgi:hypothetical protein
MPSPHAATQLSQVAAQQNAAPNAVQNPVTDYERQVATGRSLQNFNNWMTNSTINRMH